MWWPVFGLLGGILGVVLILAVAFMLTEDSLAEVVKKEEPDAFKAIIKKKKKKSVKVGIFDKEDEHLNDMEITTTKGVSRSLHKGQEIYV